MIGDFTRVVMSGRLVAEPKSIPTKTNGVICVFTIATNKKGPGGSEDTSFIPVKVVSKEAETCLKYLVKGRDVMVTGTLETSRYVDREGNNRSSFTVVVGAGVGNVMFGKGQKPRGDNSERPVINIKNIPKPTIQSSSDSPAPTIKANSIHVPLNNSKQTVVIVGDDKIEISKTSKSNSDILNDIPKSEAELAKDLIIKKIKGDRGED